MRKGYRAGENASPLSLFAMSEIFFPVFFINSNTKEVQTMSFYVIDVESDGQILGRNSLVCFGAFMEKRALSVKNTMEKRLQ